MSIRRIATLFVVSLVCPAAAAIAQPLGTFRWQIQPYCNVLTVNVTQQGGIYTIDGTDDRCGAAQAASLVGIAFFNPSSLVGFGLTAVLPNGVPVHIEAEIDISSLNGTWRDSGGNNGSFIFTPGAGTGGSPRPVPSGGVAPGTITALQIAPAAVGAPQLAANSVTGATVVDGSITSADIADGPRVAFAGGDGQFIADLPGTATIIRSVTVNAPAAGKVVVNASGFFEFPLNATIENVRCEITTAAAIDNDHAMYARERVADTMHYVPFSTTRGFDVAAGNTTFNLLCSKVAGTVNLWRSFMTATYSPQ
jgi:hypothetical protein